MNFDLAQSYAVLERTPGVLRALLAGLPEMWTTPNEGPDTWSAFNVVGHLIDGEATDWMVRARIILAQGENRRFDPFDRFRHIAATTGKTLGELLDRERFNGGTDILRGMMDAVEYVEKNARQDARRAIVIVTEVDPIKALEAVMDGYEVMRIADAARIGDIFVTVTGDKNVISWDHIQRMKDGAVMANSGHFNVEVAVDVLAQKAKSKRSMREFVTEYTLRDGSKRHVLGEGRLINLAAAEGHPAEVMDMSFANQALAAEFFAHNRVYHFPRDGQGDCQAQACGHGSQV